MDNEIEAKFKITTKQAIELEKTLKSSLRYDRLEVNEFYDSKKHKLDKRDEVLRIRKSCSFAEGNKSIVTFKGKPVKSRFKSRPEYETEVDNIDVMRKIFASLGYTKVFSFEKKRKSYDFAGCFVEIDELPLLGFFCEIEGSTEKLIEAACTNLGLEQFTPIKDGYGMLLSKHLKKHKLKCNEVKF